MFYRGPIAFLIFFLMLPENSLLHKKTISMLETGRRVLCITFPGDQRKATVARGGSYSGEVQGEKLIIPAQCMPFKRKLYANVPKEKRNSWEA